MYTYVCCKSMHVRVQSSQHNNKFELCFVLLQNDNNYTIIKYRSITQTNYRKKLHIDPPNKAEETNARDQLFSDYLTSAQSKKCYLRTSTSNMNPKVLPDQATSNQPKNLCSSLALPPVKIRILTETLRLTMQSQYAGHRKAASNIQS